LILTPCVYTISEFYIDFSLFDSDTTHIPIVVQLFVAKLNIFTSLKKERTNERNCFQVIWHFGPMKCMFGFVEITMTLYFCWSCKITIAYLGSSKLQSIQTCKKFFIIYCIIGSAL